MGKISLDITTDASTLLDGTSAGISGLKDLSAQAEKTKGVTTESFNQAGTSAANFANKIKGAGVANDEYKRAVMDKVQALYSEGKVTDALILKYGSATTALRALQQELKTMAALGQQNTAQFKELSAVTGDLANKIGNASKEVKNLSSDTQEIDAVSGGFQVLSDTVQAGAGAFVLFNNTQKAYSELATKLLGITSLLNGARNVSNNLTAQSAFLLGVESAKQKLYSLVVGESVGAMKAFRIALAGIGIGLAIFLIVELIQNFESFKKIINGINDELGKFNAMQQQRIEISEKANEQAGKEIAKLEILKQAILDQKLPREQRLIALKEYNKTAEDGNKIAVTEIDNIKLINEQIEKQIQFTLALATVKAAQNLLEEKVSERLQLELKQRTDLVKAQQAVADAQKRINEVSKNDETGSLAAKVEAQQTFAQVTGELNQLIAKQSIASKKTEIDALLQLIAEYQDKYQNVLLGIDEETKKSANRIFQSLIPNIDKKVLDENINQIVEAFGKASIGIPEQVKLLRALGFNDTAIFKALSEAADKMAKDGSGIVKLPVEPLFIAPKELPNIEVLGFKIPVKLDITQEEADKISSAINQIADNVFKTLNTAFDAAIQTQQKFIDKLDDRIEKQKDVVAAEQKLANEGKANNLAIEVAGLEKLNKARESALEKQKKIKNAQVALDTISQLSSLITASAKIYESLANIPVVGVPLATALVATMFAAFAASKVAGAVLTSQQGFREGGYTGDGDPSEVSTAQGNRGYKYHKREFVMNEQLTAEHRDFFEALHNDDKVGILFGISDLLKGTGVVLPDENLPLKLKTAKDENRRIEAEESNYELFALRKELVEIKEEVKRWRKQPKESTTSFGDKLIIKKGNKTTVVTK